MAKRDYYEVLGVAKNATEAEIKKAYRKLVVIHHPDKGGDEEKFKEISEAYDILSTPEKKTNYDTHGHNGPPQGHGMNMDDIFSQFGRQRQQQQQKRGTDIRVHIPLTLDDIFNGVEKKIKYNRATQCGSCEGKGGSDSTNCTGCNGMGVRVQVRQTNFGVIQTQVICNLCNGEGTITKTKCTTCNGGGVNHEEFLIDVNIPIGISVGHVLHMSGNGNAVKNGVNGDLLVHIKEIEHEHFTREDFDLHYKLDLRYDQLVLGDKVEIPTIDGSKIRFDIPKSSPVGKVMGIPNKGLRKLQNEGVRGKMHVTLNIIIPESVNGEEEEIIKKLREKVESVNKI